MILFTAGTFRCQTEEGCPVQKNLVASQKDEIEVDASVVVLLVSLLKQSQVFVILFAEIRSTINESQHGTCK